MKTVIQNMYNAFAEGDIPTVLAGMDDHIIWNEAEGNSLADGNPYKGADAVLNGVLLDLVPSGKILRLST